MGRRTLNALVATLGWWLLPGAWRDWFLDVRTVVAGRAVRGRRGQVNAVLIEPFGG